MLPAVRSASSTAARATPRLPELRCALENAEAGKDGEPEQFRPARFLDNPPETFSWIPFGGGIRRCIGAPFAQIEMRLILRTVLSELEPRVPRLSFGWRRGEWTRRRAITLVPAAGTRVVWERRDHRSAQ